MNSWIGLSGSFQMSKWSLSKGRWEKEAWRNSITPHAVHLQGSAVGDTLEEKRRT